jgi:guanine deaminase
MADASCAIRGTFFDFIDDPWKHIDRFAPADALITPDEFYRESRRLIERYHLKGRNLYAITPRLAVGCTGEMMDRCGQLKQEHNDCWVNTHISENPSEIRTAHNYFPGCDDYTQVHQKHGLLGPKFTAGHGVWLSNDELRRFSSLEFAECFRWSAIILGG